MCDQTYWGPWHASAAPERADLASAHLETLAALTPSREDLRAPLRAARTAESTAAAIIVHANDLAPVQRGR
jgi:hypothetical protein